MNGLISSRNTRKSNREEIIFEDNCFQGQDLVNCSCGVMMRGMINDDYKLSSLSQCKFVKQRNFE